MSTGTVGSQQKFLAFQDNLTISFYTGKKTYICLHWAVNSFEGGKNTVGFFMRWFYGDALREIRKGKMR